MNEFKTNDTNNIKRKIIKPIGPNSKLQSPKSNQKPVGTKTTKKCSQDSSKTTLDSLCTDIKYMIYSYLCSPVVKEEDGESQNGVSTLLLSIGLVSKQFHQNVRLYIRLIPFKFQIDGSSRFYLPIWMIQNQCKISSISMDCLTSLHAGLSLSALRNCDISFLTSMDMNWGMQGIALASEAEHQKAIDCGLSPTFVNLSTFISGNYDFHQATATLLQHRAPNLTKMRLLLVKEVFNPIILHATALTLVELDLTLMQKLVFSRNDWSHDVRGTWVTDAIASMPKLTKLSIIVYDYASTTFRIRSESLEEINTRGANHFFLDECICPKLKVFKCVYISHIQKTNGLMSISLLNVDDLKALYVKQQESNSLSQQSAYNDHDHRQGQDVIQSYTDIWTIRCDYLHESPLVSLPVSEYKFFGLKAPKSCIVEVQCDEILSIGSS